MSENLTNNSTNISYDKVDQNVDTIKTCSTNMGRIFEDFGTSMRELGADNVFYGDASTSLSERFNVLKSKFDEYTLTVTEFANTIKTAKDNTQHTEQGLQASAENLPG